MAQPYEDPSAWPALPHKKPENATPSTSVKSRRPLNKETIRVAPSPKKPAKAASPITATKAKSARPFLSLPAEIRIRIYTALFNITKLSTTSSAVMKYTEDELNHQNHAYCQCHWNEDELSTLRVRSNFLSDELEVGGLPTRKPIALLQTCHLIRQEGLYELYGRVEVAVRKWNCMLKQDSGFAHDHIAVRTWNLYSNVYPELLLRDFFSAAKIRIEIREGLGRNYVVGYQDNREAARRFPVQVRYICRQVRCIELCMWFGPEETHKNQIDRLTDLAVALDHESSVREIKLRILGDQCPSDYQGKVKTTWEQRHYERIRKWKHAIHKLSKKLRPTPARDVLWKKIFAESFQDISGEWRHSCKVEEILDSRRRCRQREMHHNGIAYYYGHPDSRFRFEYRVRWKGYQEPVWEEASVPLPKWVYQVIQFHYRNPEKVKPTDMLLPEWIYRILASHSLNPEKAEPVTIACLTQMDIEIIAGALGITEVGTVPSSGNQEREEGGEDIEDDEMFAKAMGKLCVKGGVPSYEYVKAALVASVGEV